MKGYQCSNVVVLGNRTVQSWSGTLARLREPRVPSDHHGFPGGKKRVPITAVLDLKDLLLLGLQLAFVSFAVLFLCLP
jgi:hypothetical protein